VTQCVYPLDKTRKSMALIELITTNDWKQVLVFSRTKHGANRLAKSLEAAGIKAAAIHGNKSQTARTKALADFKAGAVQVMVATDIAARGIDIDQLPFVVNFDLPNVPEDYVHRIGRTGRAGSTGQAISLVGLEEVKLLHDIERLINRVIERKQLAGFEAPFTIPEPSSRSGSNSVKKPNPNRSKHAQQHANDAAQADKPSRKYDSRQQSRGHENNAKPADPKAEARANGNKPPQRSRPPRRSGTAPTNTANGTSSSSTNNSNSPYANARVKS
jgi:ATP-dependent RNA helicase RhlE